MLHSLRRHSKDTDTEARWVKGPATSCLHSSVPLCSLKHLPASLHVSKSTSLTGARLLSAMAFSECCLCVLFICLPSTKIHTQWTINGCLAALDLTSSLTSFMMLSLALLSQPHLPSFAQTSFLFSVRCGNKEERRQLGDREGDTDRQIPLKTLHDLIMPI